MRSLPLFASEAFKERPPILPAVAALFVEDPGPYTGLDGVEAWGYRRDARSYPGPHPVVAHPPCKRWGRYWGGGPSGGAGFYKGDDHGCFAVALWAVRTFGGVLEHPEASHAWDWFGLERPEFLGGWTDPDRWGGRSCCVAQGHYGHPGQKMTWLYRVGAGAFPELTWGRCVGKRRLDLGIQTREERTAFRESGGIGPERLSTEERLHTPVEFRDLLISMAAILQS